MAFYGMSARFPASFKILKKFQIMFDKCINVIAKILKYHSMAGTVGTN